MLRTETLVAPDHHARAEALDLVSAVTSAAGASPLDEQKHRQLARGADRWSAVLARDDDGALRGYAHLRWGAPEAVPRASAELVIAPDAAEAVGPVLLDAVERAVADAGGGTLFTWVHHVLDPAPTVPAQRGYTLQRELARLRRPLDTVPAVPEPPVGVEVRAFVPGADDAPLLAANNAAFADHPEQGGWGPDDLAVRTAADWFDPADLLVAVRGPALLGFHWTKRVPGSATGEVYVLGVTPVAQGLGLGRTLLRAGLAHLAARGCTAVELSVDRAQTAAMALYTAEGFTPVSGDMCFAHDVASAGS